MRLIAFVGYPLSGKSTASKMAKSLGIPVVTMGDVVREEAKKRELEPTDKNLGEIAKELRAKYGMNAIAKRCIPKIEKLIKEKGVVVIDGIRGIDEVECFKKRFGENFTLIAIEAPLDVRFQRSKFRKRQDSLSSIEELKKRDEREESWGLKKAMEVADFTIENTGSMREFKEKITELLKRLSKGVEVYIETTIHPTENEGKVVNAIKNLFPDSEIEIFKDKLYARANDITKFRNLLKKQRILDTARFEFIKGRKDNEVTIYLNKQTATVSKVNFCDENATLSPLIVRFRLINVPFGRFLDYIAPETRDGKPIKEISRL